jgi:hypothetical protein
VKMGGYFRGVKCNFPMFFNCLDSLSLVTKFEIILIFMSSNDIIYLYTCYLLVVIC